MRRYSSHARLAVLSSSLLPGKLKATHGGALDDVSMLTWHVAQTKPFFEMIAEDGLRRKGFCPFNPKVYEERLVRGRRTWTERCYIPGYIFIRFDPLEDVHWPKINYVRGIHTLLYSASEKPAPIKDAAMAVLLDRCNGDRVKAEDIDLALSRVVPIGSMVRVVEGTFSEFVGKVSWSAADRVKVVLSLFGRATNVSLPSRNVVMA
jgi:transcription antitermination factor NusG